MCVSDLCVCLCVILMSLSCEKLFIVMCVWLCESVFFSLDSIVL